MLVLSRKVDEVILIGEDIEITIVRIDGGSVRVGVSAPRDVAIHREEVYEKIEYEKKKKETERQSAIQWKKTQWCLKFAEEHLCSYEEAKENHERQTRREGRLYRPERTP